MRLYTSLVWLVLLSCAGLLKALQQNDRKRPYGQVPNPYDHSPDGSDDDSTVQNIGGRPARNPELPDDLANIQLQPLNPAARPGPSGIQQQPPGYQPPYNPPLQNPPNLPYPAPNQLQPINPNVGQHYPAPPQNVLPDPGFAGLQYYVPPANQPVYQPYPYPAPAANQPQYPLYPPPGHFDPNTGMYHPAPPQHYPNYPVYPGVPQGYPQPQIFYPPPYQYATQPPRPAGPAGVFTRSRLGLGSQNHHAKMVHPSGRSIWSPVGSTLQFPGQVGTDPEKNDKILRENLRRGNLLSTGRMPSHVFGPYFPERYRGDVDAVNKLPVELQFEMLQERMISDRLGIPLDYSAFSIKMTPDEIESYKRLHVADAHRRRQAVGYSRKVNRPPSPPAKQPKMGYNGPPTPPPAGGACNVQQQPVGRRKRSLGGKAVNFGCNRQVKDLVGVPADRKVTFYFIRSFQA